MWTKVQEGQPPPHARYLVKRDGVFYTATPCYGMHSPWWVVATMEGEAPPVNMRDTDEWEPLQDVHAGSRVFTAVELWAMK